jgi:putative ABC transport system permease protein
MIGLVALNLRRRRGRTLLTAVGIAVGVATIVALLSLTTGLTRAAGQLIHLGNADFGLFQGGLSDITASTLPESLVQRARTQSGVTDAVGVQIVTNEVPADSSMLLFGARSDSFLARRLIMLSGRQAADSEAMVGDQAARRLGVRAGDTLALRHGSFRVSGVYHSGLTFEDEGVILPLAVTQRIAGRRGAVSMIAVAVARGRSRAAVAARLERALPGTLAIDQPGAVARADTNSLLLEKAALVIALVALVIGAISVTNIMLMSALERQRELGVLAAVGWSPRQLARLVFAEGVGISVLGSVVGVAIGVAGSSLAVAALAASALISPHVTAWGIGRGLLVGFAIGILGSLYPAWRVSRLDPVVALGRE